MSIKATYENGLFQSEGTEEDITQLEVCKGSDIQGYSVSIKPDRRNTIQYHIQIHTDQDDTSHQLSTDIYDEYLAYIEVIKQAMVESANTMYYIPNPEDVRHEGTPRTDKLIYDAFSNNPKID